MSDKQRAIGEEILDLWCNCRCSKQSEIAILGNGISLHMVGLHAHQPRAEVDW